MDHKIVIAIIVLVVAVVVVVAAILYERRRRSERLKQTFGSEYDRVAHQLGDPQRAETVLAEREKRVSHLKLRTLPATEKVEICSAVGLRPEAIRRRSPRCRQ